MVLESSCKPNHIRLGRNLIRLANGLVSPPWARCRPNFSMCLANKLIFLSFNAKMLDLSIKEA